MGKVFVEQVSASAALGLLPGCSCFAVAYAFEEAETMRNVVDGSSRKGVVRVACFACIIRFDAAARRVAFFVAGSFCAADALEVAAGMDEDAVAPHQGEEEAVGRSVFMEG